MFRIEPSTVVCSISVVTLISFFLLGIVTSVASLPTHVVLTLPPAQNDTLKVSSSVIVLMRIACFVGLPGAMRPGAKRRISGLRAMRDAQMMPTFASMADHCSELTPALVISCLNAAVCTMTSLATLVAQMLSLSGLIGVRMSV